MTDFPTADEIEWIRSELLLVCNQDLDRLWKDFILAPENQFRGRDMIPIISEFWETQRKKIKGVTAGTFPSSAHSAALYKDTHIPKSVGKRGET